MQAQGLSNAELPQRMGTSPAYITRLFRGSANLSADTMVELARAVESTLQVALNGQPRQKQGERQTRVQAMPPRLALPALQITILLIAVCAYF